MATEILIKSLVAFIFFLPLSYKYLTPNEKHEKDIFTDFLPFYSLFRCRRSIH